MAKILWVDDEIDLLKPHILFLEHREQNLIRVDGFYEIIGDLLSHSLIHDILLLVLGDHDHWNVRHLELDPAECLQPRQAGHILVQKSGRGGGVASCKPWHVG